MMLFVLKNPIQEFYVGFPIQFLSTVWNSMTKRNAKKDRKCTEKVDKDGYSIKVMGL